MKYIIGSNEIGLSNEKSDLDYLIIDNSVDYQRTNENDEDILRRSEENIKSYINYSVPLDNKTCGLYIFNYQLDRDLIGTDFPIDFHLLDNKNNLITILKYTIQNRLFNFNKNVWTGEFNDKRMSKLTYHIAFNIFILVDNSVKITNEHLQIVQKIKNGEMSIDYIDELTNEFSISNSKSV